jgi:hypothetical protein
VRRANAGADRDANARSSAAGSTAPWNSGETTGSSSRRRAFGAQQVDDGRDDAPVVRQAAVLLGHVPGAFAGTHGEGERHRAIAPGRHAEIEFGALVRQRRHRVLPHPRDDQAAFIVLRPARAFPACGQQPLRVGSQFVVRPGVHVEEIVTAGDGRIGQQLVQRGQRSKHDPRQVFGRVAAVDGR